MMSAVTARSEPAGMALRLLLALLLLVAPLLTVAGGMSPAGNGADTAETMAAHAHHAMPCHAVDGPTKDSVPEAVCPHCSGDGPLSQCECCTFAAPPGLVSLDAGPTQPPFNGMTTRLPRSGPLPESPGDRLFRPPIVPC